MPVCFYRKSYTYGAPCSDYRTHCVGLKVVRVHQGRDAYVRIVATPPRQAERCDYWISRNPRLPRQKRLVKQIVLYLYKRRQPTSDIHPPSSDRSAHNTPRLPQASWYHRRQQRHPVSEGWLYLWRMSGWSSCKYEYSNREMENCMGKRKPSLIMFYLLSFFQ